MKALVTGGGGFLGSAIVRQLRDRGDDVRSLARGDYPALREQGAEVIRGDVAELATVSRAVAGCDLVFHAAAKARVWGTRREFERANVEGTRNVIEACRTHGIKALVFTSSPSVVFNGRDMEGVDESAPYPARFEADYPATKARAEQMVLQANGPDLATVALRPHLIWGPGDPHLVPRILARGKAGRLRRIGRRNPLVDSIYVDNAAEAHLLAADRLAPSSPISGRAFFVTQGEPWPVWDLVNAILRTGGVPPITRTVPTPFAVAVGSILETAYRVVGATGEPPMTRFVARELSTAHWFDITAARRDLGYEPRISIDEGLRRLERSLLPEQRG